MGRVGRFVCVAAPFGLTVVSLICILVVCLAGISQKSLYLMEVDTANFTISESTLESLVSKRSDLSHLTAAATTTTTTTSTSSSTNITASELGLADTYKINIWNYCTTNSTSTVCSSPAFNWAATATNTTAFIATIKSEYGVTITIPSAATSAISTFSTVLHWTEIAYVIAGAVTIIELFIGLFALCSRIGSCITFIISGVSTVAIIAASALATVLASVSVETVDTLAKYYGVTASINTSFLIVTWVGALFSLGSGLFWMFSICCCKPSSSSRHSKGEKSYRNSDSHYAQAPLVAHAAGFSGYQPVQDPYQHQESGTTYGGYGVPMGQVKNHRQQQGAYEPYSHAAV